jgi:hypothetical protein
MSTSNPAGWFITATSNGDTFADSKTNDLMIYTDLSTQTIIFGSASSQTSSLQLSTSNSLLLSQFVVQSNVIMNSNGIFLNSNNTISFGSLITLNSNGLVGNGIIPTQSLSNSSVTTSKLSNLSVTSNILAYSAVTDDKIAYQTISTNSLSNGCITSEKMSTLDKFYINNLHISPAGSNLPVLIGYSNWDISTTYAIGQSPTCETYINSGSSNPIHFSVGGVELMTLNSAGDLDISGLVTQTSDRNLKYDISPVTDGLNKILQLNGYTYRMRNNEHNQSAGLIAQEVQSILPQAVKTSKATNTLTLDYAAMSSLYVEAIKDLHKLIVELQNKINQ